MKAIVLATTLFATAFGHADANAADDGPAKAPEGEAVETLHTQVEAAEAQMEVARAQMEAARAQIQTAAKRMAEVARTRLQAGYKRAFLGVLIGDESEDGIVVAGVTPGGGAEAAGIETEDIIVAVNGEPLAGHKRPLEVLHRILDGVAPGTDVEVVVSRDGEAHSFDAVPTSATVIAHGFINRSEVPRDMVAGQIARLREGFERSRSDRFGHPGGLHLVDIGEDLGDYFGVDGGVLVLNVPGKSELKPGDIVRRIDGDDVGSSDEAYRLLAGSSDEDAELEVRRKNRKMALTVAKASPRMVQRIRTMPKGYETVTVSGSVPVVEVEIEVEESANP